MDSKPFHMSPQISPMKKTSQKSRVFLVSHNFPPTMGPESSLVKLNALDLLRRGWLVSVMTTTMEHMHQGIDHMMLDSLPANLEILRTPSYDALLRKRWPRIASMVLTVLHRWILPEIFLLWLFSSVPAGKRWLKKNGPAIIYSRATKHVSNVTGWFLKRATGLPWVAHMSDPWVEVPYFNPLQRWIALQFERRIFRDADAIVTVSRGLADYILRLHPWARHKVHIIPHGFAPLDKPPAPVTGAGSRPLQALYAGSLTPTLREPDKLFSALVLLNESSPLHLRLQVTFVGDDTIRYQGLVDSLGLTNIVRLLSPVPYQTCQDMIDKSDLLLVLDTHGFGGIFLPTKLIEYLPYAKPVLGLAEPDSTIHKLLKECDLTFADQDKPVDIAAAFENLLRQWETGVWEVSAKSREQTQSYRIDRVNDRLDELLLRLA
jgi:glycosyltransferase involved in cell wall biosynthesis